MAKRNHSALGKRLIALAREMLAHSRGELELETEEVRVPSSVKSTQTRLSEVPKRTVPRAR